MATHPFNENLLYIVHTTHDSKWSVYQAAQYHWILESLSHRKYILHSGTIMYCSYITTSKPAKSYSLQVSTSRIENNAIKVTMATSLPLQCNLAKLNSNVNNPSLFPRKKSTWDPWEPIFPGTRATRMHPVVENWACFQPLAISAPSYQAYQALSFNRSQ